jgi:transposase
MQTQPSARKHLRVRQERSRPLITVQSWLREQCAKLSRNRDTTKAINYRHHLNSS